MGAPYQRAWLVPDLLAGVIVRSVVVPQAVAYAQIAGLPPSAGLAAAPGALPVTLPSALPDPSVPDAPWGELKQPGLLIAATLSVGWMLKRLARPPISVLVRDPAMGATAGALWVSR